MSSRNAVATAALALVALISATTLASAATTPPVIKAVGGSTGGQIASPGDPFRPFVVDKTIETFSMSCGIGEGKFLNGASIIKMVNTSSKTIPKGAKIVVTYADGSTETFTAPSDIKPGAAVSIMGPPGATPESFGCSAEASRKIPLGMQGSPQVDNGPGPIEALPPKLTCWFEVVDGKVVIHWKNEGGSSILPGAMITGKNAAGVGVSWYIQEPIKPGQEVSTVLDIDPALANEACIATVKY